MKSYDCEAVTELSTKRNWYLVYSKARQEQVARDHLLRQGYEVYLPLLRNRKRRAGFYQDVVEPMFPRYLFVRLNTATDNWGAIRSTRGVSGLVCFGMQLAEVSDQVVNDLKSKGDDCGIQGLLAPKFVHGNKVRIVEGPMTGYEGLFMAKNGQERVLILLEIAGQIAKLNLKKGDLEAVG